MISSPDLLPVYIRWVEFFLIGGLHIHVPEIMMLSQKVSDRQDSCQHGMVLIIIPVKSVTTDGLQVRDSFQVVPYHLQMLAVIPIINRIGLRLTEDHSTFQI